jgi:leucyl aminopeptidase
MLARLKIAAEGRRRAAPAATHRLIVGPPPADGKTLAEDLPAAELLAGVLRRGGKQLSELRKSPLAATAADGGLLVWILWDGQLARFDRLTSLRKAVAQLLDDGARELAVELAEGLPQAAADELLYVCWINGVTLPSARAEAKRPPLATIRWSGLPPAADAVRPLAEGNVLARRLTAMAPNVLTPAVLRREALALARADGLQSESFGLAALEKLGCGAFLSVARGSADDEAAIVRLRYSPRRARARVALVGKGICFDTGGYNLKPARAMAGMHEDMAGAATVLGVIHAASALKLPLAIEAWLAISRNRLAPGASVPGDVVRAINGKSIEIVHTDAEGRMVLADTLALAVRSKPDLVIDFATLTGSMVVALGCRMAGVLSPDPLWAARFAAAGARVGERLVAFPVPDDYLADLESEVADLKQCTPDSEADHILAARFLQHFVADRPWLHVDLSAVRCKGGLGPVASELTGFGVASGIEMLRDFAADGGHWGGNT